MALESTGWWGWVGVGRAGGSAGMRGAYGGGNAGMTVGLWAGAGDRSLPSRFLMSYIRVEGG